MSRSEILERIKANRPELVNLPDITQPANKNIPVADIENLFTERLTQVGGEVIFMKNPEETIRYLKDKFPSALDLSSDNAAINNFNKDDLYDNLEALILKSRIGVAENGAVWLDERNFPVRLLPFVTQQLIIRIESKNIVSTMHDAYNRIDPAETGFGVFISGPSKTADIEQSLVFGAHGAKSLILILERF